VSWPHIEGRREGHAMTLKATLVFLGASGFLVLVLIAVMAAMQ
jgi:hypothetical protein